MKYKCEECGFVMDKELDNCPKCGASFIEEKEETIVIEEKKKPTEKFQKEIEKSVDMLYREIEKDQIEIIAKILFYSYLILLFTSQFTIFFILINKEKLSLIVVTIILLLFAIVYGIQLNTFYRKYKNIQIDTKQFTIEEKTLTKIKSIKVELIGRLVKESVLVLSPILLYIFLSTANITG